MPLDNLWNNDGPLEAVKGRQLSKDDIKGLLRLGPVSFVVVDTGHPMRWIAAKGCFDFWKSEAEVHLHEIARRYYSDYPEEYFYFAHEWILGDGVRIVVLEKHH
ncbi:hypothetical protein CCAX7_20490 [Capsulimonas corticalis]|uniref:Uncharacterized protein n=1 Tax=Capsulimonas corticalis TaxID=2219043 RepID=A0A402D2C4_9BACT|nr:hypothetical protein [Capsulimonas corticalis]BDI29998.1 hypothetical protein CCAX7_20490 [Capsulimonas corticalis]